MKMGAQAPSKTERPEIPGRIEDPIVDIRGQEGVEADAAADAAEENLAQNLIQSGNHFLNWPIILFLNWPIMRL